MLKEGRDYYIENGLLVFTEKYHLARGYCCGSGCRHCPYSYINVPQPKRQQLLSNTKKQASIFVKAMEKYIQNTIEINAPAAVVWDMLVNPVQTKKYMFGCETVSDWKPGSPLLWKMMHEGKEFIPVKGTVIDIQPLKRLEYTVIDPNGSIPDVPENYLTVIYELQPQNGHTLLTVTQGDYATVAEGERRYTESYNNGEGWNPILVQIKQLAEEQA